MAYNQFTVEKLFEDEAVNILLNRIVEAFKIAFGDTETDADLALTGSVAKMIQGATLAPIKVVPFATSNTEFYDFVKQKLDIVVPPIGSVKFSNVIQFQYQESYVEFWLLDPLTIITSNNLQVQTEAEIPSDIN